MLPERSTAQLAVSSETTIYSLIVFAAPHFGIPADLLYIVQNDMPISTSVYNETVGDYDVCYVELQR